MAAGLSYFGFFSELGFRVGSTVSATSIERAPCADRAGVVAYLRMGSPLVVVPGCITDPLSESGRMVMGGGSVLTDGEWIWPQIAADFVQMYDIAVPNAFLKRMRGMEFAIRPLSGGEVRKVFALAKEALSVEPLGEMPHIATGVRLVILDIRQVGDRIIDCIARSDGVSVYEGREVRDISSDGTDADLIKVARIARRDEQLSHLATGQTAIVTLTGARVAQLGPRAVLVAMEME